MRTTRITFAAITMTLLGALAANGAPVKAPGPQVAQPAPPTGVADVQQTATKHGTPRLALSLGGGGGRGAAHIGVLKVLEANGIKPDFVTGSSIGAVIGSLYCAGVPVSRIEQMALDGELRKAMMPGGGLKWQVVKTVPKYAFLRLIGMHPKIGLYSGKAVTRFIERNIPENERNIENLKIPFAAVATNLLDTRPVWISKGSVAEAVRASTSVPFVFVATDKDGKELIDGGVREVVPSDVAKASGATMNIAVKLNGSLDRQKPETFRNFLDYSDRVLTILMSEIESKTETSPDVVIAPKITNTVTYTFGREDMAKAIAAGEEAATKMLPEIREKMLKNLGTASTGSGPQ